MRARCIDRARAAYEGEHARVCAPERLDSYQYYRGTHTANGAGSLGAPQKYMKYVILARRYLFSGGNKRDI